MMMMMTVDVYHLQAVDRKMFLCEMKPGSSSNVLRCEPQQTQSSGLVKPQQTLFASMKSAPLNYDREAPYNVDYYYFLIFSAQGISDTEGEETRI